ncbi:MAG: PAS domain-containing protein [Nitrospira sp.]|nr:PAS domain-containing protein [Nitrospira sp.]
MAKPPPTVQTLLQENRELRARLEESDSTLRAIREGEVDALVVEGAAGPRLFTLQGLDAEQTRFRSEMLARVSDAVIAVDAEERITFLNAAAERLYGVRSDDVLGCTFTEMFTPHWPSAEAEITMRTALRERGEWRGELIHRAPDGRERHVEMSTTALRDPDGAGTGYIKVIRDILDRKKLEEEKADALRLLDTLLTRAPVGFAYFDRDLRYVRINERLAEMDGISVAAHLGRTVGEIVPTLEGAVREATERILATGEAVLHHEFSGETALAPGATRYWNESWYPVHGEGGEIVGFGAVVEEITERKQAEEAQRQSRERILLASEAAQMGFWSWRPDEDSVLWETQYPYRILGVPLGSPPVTAARFVAEFIHPDDRPIFEQAVAQTLEAREPFAFVGRIRRSDGEARWLEFTSKRDAAENGRATRIIGTVQDITDRLLKAEALRASEEQFRALAGQLEHVVKERTEELVQSQDRLRALATMLNLTEQRERKRLADELHDYLTQLLVLGLLNLGQMKRIGLPPKAVEKVQETEGVLTQALTYSRTLMAELSPPVLQEHGLPAGLKWLGEQMQRQGLMVLVEIGNASTGSLSNDCAVLLFQSVRELLMNALKHAGCQHVYIRLQEGERRLCIEVRDDGVGFDLAAAGCSTTAMSSKFGLFSIRERMTALGGWFDLQSAPGEGTTATLMLPVDSTSEPSSELQVLSAELSDQGRNSGPRTPNSNLHQQDAKICVLLVDDHAMVRQGLRTVLDAYPDVEVVGEACNGEEAVAFVERVQPSIVVMDINMPKMNGIDATAAIVSRYPGTVVIGLSVQAGGANEEAMKHAGAALLLTKEAAVDELYRVIRETLGAKLKGTALGAGLDK